MAFFEEPSAPFDFKVQRDFDLHIAFETTYDHMLATKKRAEEHGLECRGVSDHGFIHSIYLRDPNGYCVELTCQVEESSKDGREHAHNMLAEWQQNKLKSKL